MTTTAFFDIESMLQTKLLAISGSPNDVEFEGTKPLTPIIGTRYWRTSHIPVATVQVNASALRQITGIYQVDIIIPPERGLKQMMLDMDLIAGSFDTTTSVNAFSTKIQIDGVNRGRVTREDNGWLYGFVRINYTGYSY